MRTMTILCAAVLVALPGEGVAQRRAGPPNRMERGALAGIERALRDRERLSLSADQVRQLEELRAAEVEREGRRSGAMRDLLSRARAGLVERDSLRASMNADRAALQEERAQMRERFDGILSEEQRGELREGLRADAMRRGPGRSQGMHGFRGPAGPRAGAAAPGGRYGRQRGPGWGGWRGPGPRGWR